MGRTLHIIYVILFTADFYHILMSQPAEKSTKLPDKCGLVSTGDKITNGRDANLGQFPFMALLGYTKNVFNVSLVQFNCGGTIINEEHVLTAAHCFSTSLTFVRVGELDLNKEVDCFKTGSLEVCADPYVDIPIQRKIIHSNYMPSNFKNDIALVKLARKISFTAYIQPICLPLGVDYNNLIKSSLIVSGWGKTISNANGGSSILQFAMINAWSTKECENVVIPEVRPLKETQVCANGAKGQDACRGDSGGPLFSMEAIDYLPTYFQVGIVSFGATSVCGNTELPSIYTRVDKYIDWIIESI